MTILEGWDSRAWIDGPWIHRAPRRPAVRPRLLAETTLLPWLAPQLPLPVPVPEPTDDGVRHLLLPGEPFTAGDRARDEATGQALGGFLKALHAVDPEQAVAHGVLDAAAATAEKEAGLSEFRSQIVPLLPAEVHDSALQLLARVARVRTSLIHCDLGPEHILMTGDRITGIIDWTDAVVGDPALDLCWPLNGAPAAVRTGVIAAYRPTPDVIERSADWARLSPWYGVHYALNYGQPDGIGSGLREIVAAL